MKVFFFHHAGGDQYAFRNLKNALVDSKIKPITIDYAGHGERFSEGLADNIHTIVEDIYQKHGEKFKGDFAFFGVSMGTLVSFLIAQKLREQNLAMPLHYFAASRKCPAAHKNYPKISHLNADEFWEKVNEYGGCPPALMQHKELRELYEPIIKADFKALEDYEHLVVKPLEIPATILYGADDRFNDGDMDSWQNHFVHTVDIKKFEGGHFFCYEKVDLMIDVLNEKLNLN